MGKYFGTDGFRGEAGVTLTAADALNTGYAVGSYIKKACRSTRVIVGKDTRLSSDMLEHALCAGLAASGTLVELAGIIPTAGISYLTEMGKYDLGVMISASHNPYLDNGIKLVGASGEKLSDEAEAEIEMLMDGGVSRKNRSIGKIRSLENAIEAYTEHLIELAEFPLGGMRIALDAANGAASKIARSVLERLGADVTAIADEPNGININDGVGSTHPERLSRTMRSQSFDLGIALDGDADRCIAADEHGELVDGDGILYVLARRMAESGRLVGNTVVTTVASNLGLSRALSGLGISTVSTAVGDRYVYEKMRECKYALGGEKSGHVIIGEEQRTGDGILTAIKLAETIVKAGMPLSRLVEPLVLLPQCTSSVRVRDKSVIDGIRVKNTLSYAEQALGAHGRVILRKSGTEPLIRIIVEGEREELCRALSDTLAAAIREEDGDV